MELGNEKFAKQLYYSLFADILAAANQPNNQNLTAQDAKPLQCTNNQKKVQGRWKTQLNLDWKWKAVGPMERAQWNGGGTDQSARGPHARTQRHNIPHFCLAQYGQICHGIV